MNQIIFVTLSSIFSPAVMKIPEIMHEILFLLHLIRRYEIIFILDEPFLWEILRKKTRWISEHLRMRGVCASQTRDTSSLDRGWDPRIRIPLGVVVASFCRIWRFLRRLQTVADVRYRRTPDIGHNRHPTRIASNLAKNGSLEENEIRS